MNKEYLKKSPEGKWYLFELLNISFLGSALKKCMVNRPDVAKILLPLTFWKSIKLYSTVLLIFTFHHTALVQ
jgi:hypothetical protein